MRFPNVLTFLRRHALLPLLVGATVFQLGGCDPQVRNALLSGLQTSIISLLTTLVNVFFLALQNTNIPTTQRAVQATFEGLQKVLA